jgi:hypothetical protein
VTAENLNVPTFDSTLDGRFNCIFHAVSRLIIGFRDVEDK